MVAVVAAVVFHNRLSGDSTESLNQSPSSVPRPPVPRSPESHQQRMVAGLIAEWLPFCADFENVAVYSLVHARSRQVISLTAIGVGNDPFWDWESFISMRWFSLNCKVNDSNFHGDVVSIRQTDGSSLDSCRTQTCNSVSISISNWNIWLGRSNNNMLALESAQCFYWGQIEFSRHCLYDIQGRDGY